MSVITVRYKGRDWTIKELAKESGIPQNTMYQRLMFLGWSVEEAVNFPLQKGTHEYKGKLYSARDLAKMNGTMTTAGMAERLRKVECGLMTMEEAVTKPCRGRRCTNVFTA